MGKKKKQKAKPLMSQNAKNAVAIGFLAAMVIIIVIPKSGGNRNWEDSELRFDGCYRYLYSTDTDKKGRPVRVYSWLRFYKNGNVYQITFQGETKSLFRNLEPAGAFRKEVGVYKDPFKVDGETITFKKGWADVVGTIKKDKLELYISNPKTETERKVVAEFIPASQEELESSKYYK